MALNVTPDTSREYSRIPDSSKFPSAVVFNETAIAADGKIVFRTIDKRCKSNVGNERFSRALDCKGGLCIGAWDRLFAGFSEQNRRSTGTNQRKPLPSCESPTRALDRGRS